MPTINKFRKSAYQFLPWLIMFGAGFILRIWQLPAQLLADDEWHAVHKLVQSDFSNIFMSFGRADHSIPLTLFYKMLTLTTGLSEWAMRLPLLVAGLLSLVLMPWLLRETIRVPERLMFACLLAFSPILIYFSRTARPYGLTVLLAFTALIAFYQWWIKPDIKWAVVYVSTAALAAWFNPLTLAVTLTPFVYFGALAVWAGIRERKFQGLIRLSLIGLSVLVPLLLLLAPPVYHDYSSLLAKSGIDSVSFSSLSVTLTLFIGSASLFINVSWVLLAMVGARVLVSRQPLLAYYFASAVLIASLIIISRSAAWIHHPLVLARYLLPLLPILLLLVALGMVHLVQVLYKFMQWPLMTGVILVLYLTGPLPAQYHHGLNQFTGHMSYQYDYDRDRNIYNQQLKLTEKDIPDFYKQLAKLPADSVKLIVAPWYSEWHRNTWHLHQQVHQQRILAGFLSGLCTGSTRGEYSPDETIFNFRNAVHISEIYKFNNVNADYLVYHRKLALQPPKEARPDLDLELCELRINSLFGPPIIDDGLMLVYRLH